MMKHLCSYHLFVRAAMVVMAMVGTDYAHGHPTHKQRGSIVKTDVELSVYQSVKHALHGMHDHIFPTSPINDQKLLPFLLGRLSMIKTVLNHLKAQSFAAQDQKEINRLSTNLDLILLMYRKNIDPESNISRQHKEDFQNNGSRSLQTFHKNFLNYLGNPLLWKDIPADNPIVQARDIHFKSILDAVENTMSPDPEKPLMTKTLTDDELIGFLDAYCLFLKNLLNQKYNDPKSQEIIASLGDMRNGIESDVRAGQTSDATKRYQDLYKDMKCGLSSTIYAFDCPATH